MKKTKFGFLLILAIFLCAACPAPRFNHVVVNESDESLQIEYEYVLPDTKYDRYEITTPAVMPLAEYNGESGKESVWRQIMLEKDFQKQSRVETDAPEAGVSANGEKLKTTIETVRLTLAPQTVLRVFVSEHINSSPRNLRRIVLRGARGRFEAEGKGFEQFAEYRSGGFFSGKNDYRIVYK